MGVGETVGIRVGAGVGRAVITDCLMAANVPDRKTIPVMADKRIKI